MKVGDWVEARFHYEDSIVTVNGPLNNGFGNSLLLWGAVVRYHNGKPNEYLTSITRVPRPIPSEPEVGSFALLDDSRIAKSMKAVSTEGWWTYDWGSDSFRSWPEIYPHITRLYTPSGDLVTGFEYAGGESK